MTLQEAKEQVVYYMREMYHQDMVNLFEGNVSMRWEDRFLITPSQTDKETMTADMVLEVDENGTVLNPECGKRPSSEFKMHLQAYKVCPQVNAVVHNHSAYASAFAAAGLPIQSKGLAEVLEIFEEIPLVPYGRPGTPEIAAGFEEYLPRYSAVLLENHGMVAVGPNLLVAYSQARAVEKIAKIIICAKILGGEKPLPEEEVAALQGLAQMYKKAAAGK